MASINKVFIMGNVGRDPEVKAFQNGDKIANFSIATSEKWTDKATFMLKESLFIVNTRLLMVLKRPVLRLL